MSAEQNAWYVIQSRPRQEMVAVSAIEARFGLETYFPEVRQKVDGGQKRIPLFPGYLFVEATETDLPLYSLGRTPGILRVVAFGGVPSKVESDTVAALRARCAAFNREGGLPRHRFQPGDPVRLARGPLAGLEGIFRGPMGPASRVEVLLRFLGRDQTTQVAVQDLEPATNGRPDKRPRRTRGRGRPLQPSSS